ATELAIVSEQAGRGLMTEPIAVIAAAARAVVEGGNATLAGELLPRLLAGKTVVVPVLPDISAAADDAAPFSAASAGSGLRLDGRARFVAGAAGADGFILPASGR